MRVAFGSVTTKAAKLDVSEPCLPRKRKRPARYEDGKAAAEFCHTPEHYYRVTVYNRAIDLIVACLADRFDQPGYRMYSTLEQLLLKVCRGEVTMKNWLPSPNAIQLTCIWQT